ncbi:MAG: TIGR02594 family protein [Pseudomonadota bacterium]
MTTSERTPPWMQRALRERGTTERPGAAHNAKIVAYYAAVGHAGIKRDEVAWCAAFAGAMLERSGIASSRSLMARSYARWGQRLKRPRRGCIVVLSRTTNPALGHVGFFLRETATHVVLLGGNQANAVNERRYAKARVVAYRWPRPANVRKTPPLDEAFEHALEHVLRFEGGYSDHAADPGGPTFRGVTIGLLADHLGSRLRDWRRSTLISGVKALDPGQVRTIYRTQFWVPISAHRLPAGVDLMVFDAAVQHGPRRAIKMLQRAVAVDDDGEIGPITRAAIAAHVPAKIVSAIGEDRRRFYRSLKHFIHFGRGWMRRLDATIAQGLERANHASAPGPVDNVSPVKEPTLMEKNKKWWAESLTLWGTFITALATVLPIVAPLLGLDITSAMVEQFGDAVATLIQAVGGVVGTALAIFGRLRATTALSQKLVQVKL